MTDLTPPCVLLDHPVRVAAAWLVGLPFSGEALEDAKALIRDQLDFYRSQPLKPDWFALFLDAYHAKLRIEGRKLQWP